MDSGEGRVICPTERLLARFLAFLAQAPVGSYRRQLLLRKVRATEVMAHSDSAPLRCRDASFRRCIWVYRSWKSPTRVSLAAALKAEPFTTEPFTIPDTFDEYLGSGSSPPHVLPLSVGFFGLYLLMATQDIAVDGWALTMLSKRNVSWASTCNTTGLDPHAISFSSEFRCNCLDFKGIGPS